ncbi:MAG: hypothetical protein B6U69_01155 [Thermofilum sp. ex4484_15]|nr:MAG: hypothetical protein B6U69_01155 [Thermofilum sp. ex4484_15]
MGIEGEFKPLVSVVVCTRRRYKYLRDLLESLKKQVFRDFEVIIVEDSEDADHKLKVMELAKEFSKYLKVKVLLNASNLGIPVSLNRGISEARGDIIAFTDDDCIADRLWLKRLIKWYKDPGVGGVGGKVVPVEEDLRWSRRDFKVRALVGKVTWDGDIISNFDLGEEVIYVDCLPGANMSFRKDIIMKLGGFSPIYRGNAYRFETDLCLKVKKMSYKIIYDPKAVIFHRRAKDGGARMSVYNWNYWFARNHLLLILSNFNFKALKVIIFVLKQLTRILKRERACPYANPKDWRLVLIKFLRGVKDGIKEYLRSLRPNGSYMYRASLIIRDADLTAISLREEERNS